MTPGRGARLLLVVGAVTALHVRHGVAQIRSGAPRLPRVGVPVAGMDIAPVAIGLSPDNHIGYTLHNFGLSAITVPFVSDILVDGVRRDTYKHAPLAAQSDQTVVSQLARLDSCGTVAITVVADAQHVVAEANETNNTQSVTLTPRCPDLTVTEIKQDWQDLNTRFRVQVTVKNVGSLAMPHTAVARAWGGPEGALAGLDIGAWPILDDVEIGRLSPGQATTFHLSGTYLGTDAVVVKVYCDFYHQIVEPRVDNNLGTKHFGPH